MIKRRTGQATTTSHVSGRSLCRGFITSAVTAGKPMNKIIEVTSPQGHAPCRSTFDDAQ